MLLAKLDNCKRMRKEGSGRSTTAGDIGMMPELVHDRHLAQPTAFLENATCVSRVQKPSTTWSQQRAHERRMIDVRPVNDWEQRLWRMFARSRLATHADEHHQDAHEPLWVWQAHYRPRDAQMGEHDCARSDRLKTPRRSRPASSSSTSSKRSDRGSSIQCLPLTCRRMGSMKIGDRMVRGAFCFRLPVVPLLTCTKRQPNWRFQSQELEK